MKTKIEGEREWAEDGDGEGEGKLVPHNKVDRRMSVKSKEGKGEG